MATRRSFTQRVETFGYDTPKPWAEHTIRLLFNAPRVYEPLARAWEQHHRNTMTGLARLTALGFAACQEPVIADTTTGQAAQRRSTPVNRWKITQRGRGQLNQWQQNPAEIKNRHPKTADRHIECVIALLDAYNPANTATRAGVSARAAHTASGFATPTASRWWINNFKNRKLIRQIRSSGGKPLLLADVREVVPRHWRPTRLLSVQLADLAAHLGSVPVSVTREYRLRRARYLDDIDLGRVSVDGATDYAHDVETQRIVAAMLKSPDADAGRVFRVEPRIAMPAHNQGRRHPKLFAEDGGWEVVYQPDAEYREQSAGRGHRRGIVEYERYQTRRDAWSHIERMCGYMHTMARPSEAAVLRFVVDTNARQNYYTQLIEAFCDWGMDHPERMPRNEIMLCVSSTPKIMAAVDPLDDDGWDRQDRNKPASEQRSLDSRYWNPHRFF